MFNRKEIKEKGKLAFKANYWKCVLGALILGVASGASGGSSSANSSSSSSADIQDAISSGAIGDINIAAIVGIVAGIVGIAFIIGIVVKAFLLNPLAVGGHRFFMLNCDSPAEVGEFGYAFKGNYMNIVKIMFFKDLYTFLWSLLFVIPGIVKSYEYRMIPYLLAEDSSLDKDEAFARTKEMMTGQKGNVFVYDLSFFGWIILTIFTCGILGIFYVNPYKYSADAEIYCAFRDDDVVAYIEG